MSRPSLVVVLAEDQRHQRFVRQFLYRKGFSTHDIRMEPLPGGRGCGEQWVRERYQTAVQAHRARSARAKSALIVIIDADTNEPDRRRRQFRSALAQAGMEERRPTEPIVHLIPRRNIETWILCLVGQPVDEIADYRKELVEQLIKDASLAFFDASRANTATPAHFVESLRAAVLEIRRLD